MKNIVTNNFTPLESFSRPIGSAIDNCSFRTNSVRNKEMKMTRKLKARNDLDRKEVKGDKWSHRTNENHLVTTLFAFLLLSFSLLPFPSFAEGGFTTGGGSAVKYSTSSEVHFYDIWEREQVFKSKGVSYVVPQVSSTLEGIDLILNNLGRGPLSQSMLNSIKMISYMLLSEIEAQEYKNKFFPKEKEVKRKLKAALLMDNSKIRKVSEIRQEDSRHFIEPAAPDEHLYVGYYSSSNYLFVANRLYVKMPFIHRSAFIVHEALYLLLRLMFQEASSDYTRLVVSHAVLGTDFDKIEIDLSQNGMICRVGPVLNAPNRRILSFGNSYEPYLKSTVFLVQQSKDKTKLEMSFIAFGGVPQATVVKAQLERRSEDSNDFRSENMFDIFSAALQELQPIDIVGSEEFKGTRLENYLKTMLAREGIQQTHPADGTSRDSSLTTPSVPTLEFGKQLYFTSQIMDREKEELLWVDFLGIADEETKFNFKFGFFSLPVNRAFAEFSKSKGQENQSLDCRIWKPENLQSLMEDGAFGLADRNSFKEYPKSK